MATDQILLAGMAVAVVGLGGAILIPTAAITVSGASICGWLGFTGANAGLGLWSGFKLIKNTFF